MNESFSSEKNIALSICQGEVRELLFEGNFGLEKESLRVTKEGRMAHTPHRFVNDPRISRDFCENQTEINTHAFASIEEAFDELKAYNARVRQVIRNDGEVLWPFSNPPYLEGEEDIPVARFTGSLRSKTKYREYLAKKYGRYIMTFSGVHFNFSFSKELLKRDWEQKKRSQGGGEIGSAGVSLEGGMPGSAGTSIVEGMSFRDYSDGLYLALARRAAVYGWLMVSVCAASPVVDESFNRGTEGNPVLDGNLLKGTGGGTHLTEYASVRCSDKGYWNEFPVVLDYSSIGNYAASVQRYIDEGLITAPSELYYPIRIKSSGEYSLEELVRTGADHIELRMIDLNPFEGEGVDIRDMKFAHLLLVWLACGGGTEAEHWQLSAIDNFKSAAAFDIDKAKVVLPDGRVSSVRRAALEVIDSLEDFYRNIDALDCGTEKSFTEKSGTEKPGIGLGIKDILGFEREKFLDDSRRYACRLAREFGADYVRRGVKLAESY